MTRRIVLGALVYLVPTFALGFVWHLVLFKAYYEALAMYRHEVIIPFGFLSMSIQAVLFAWIYDNVFARRAENAAVRGLAYAAFGFALSWSFTTIAVAAKNVMSSVPDYLLIETAFTAVQWAIVGPLTAFVLPRPSAAGSTWSGERSNA
jgi:uncharacterized membrane protein